MSSVDTRTPWQAAVQEFDRIDRLDLPGDGRFKEHYTLIARVIQGYVRASYIEGVGRTDATDMTTEEIRSAIRQSSLDRKNARLVLDLLLEADLVRFSSYAPSASRAYGALRDGREIVKETKPAGDGARQREDALAQPEATA